MATKSKTDILTSTQIDNSAILSAFVFLSDSTNSYYDQFDIWSSTSLTYNLKIDLYDSTYYASKGMTGVYWDDNLTYAIQSALADISSVSNLTFTETNSSADIDFWYYQKSASNILGFSELVGGKGVFINESNVYTKSVEGSDGLTYGGYNYRTVIHEILHNIGVSHPHDSHENLPGVFGSTDTGDYSLNQNIYSVMSYNRTYQYAEDGTQTTGWPFTGSTADRSFAVMGAFDIAIIQQLYGVNVTTAIGDDTYVIPDANVTGTHYKAIWDVYGTDQIVYYGSRNVTIDLRAATLKMADGYLAGGGLSKSDGVYGGFTIANGVVIENATGGLGDDYIFGNGGDNILTGNSGNDWIADTFGDNALYGGSGHDMLRNYSGNNYLNGGAGDDFLLGGVGSDHLVGSSGYDVLRGDIGSGMFGGSDTLDGGTGNDTLMGGAGADVFYFNTYDGSDVIGTFLTSQVYSDSAGYYTYTTGADFEIGIDTVELSGFSGVNAGNVMSFVTDGSTGAIFSAEGTSITFYGIFASELSSGDFLFS